MTRFVIEISTQLHEDSNLFFDTHFYFMLTYFTSLTISCPSLESMKSINLAIVPAGFPFVYIKRGRAMGQELSRTVFAEAVDPFTFKALIDLSMYPIPIYPIAYLFPAT